MSTSRDGIRDIFLHVFFKRRQKWHDVNRNFHPDDHLIVMNKRLSHNRWPLGVIMETFPVRGERVRVVKLNFQDSVCERPVSKLVLLKVYSNLFYVDGPMGSTKTVSHIEGATPRMTGLNYDQQLLFFIRTKSLTTLIDMILTSMFFYVMFSI